METLTIADWQRLNEFLKSLYTPCSLEQFPGAILAALPSVISGELFGIANFTTTGAHPPRFYTFPVTEAGVVAEMSTSQRKNFVAHPVAKHYLLTMDGQALAISDFWSEEVFHKHEALYSDFFQCFGLEDQMATCFNLPSKLQVLPKADLFHQGQEHFSVLISRDRRNFTGSPGFAVIRQAYALL